MGNSSNKNIQKITYKELKQNYEQYILISIYTHIEDVIAGTAFFSEEEHYIEQAIKNNKKIIFYGINKNDINYYRYIHEIYGNTLGYENIYFYENGLDEWLKLRHIYGNDEYPIYRYV